MRDDLVAQNITTPEDASIAVTPTETYTPVETTETAGVSTAAADLERESSACFQEARSKPRAAPALYAANPAQAATNAFMSGFAEGLQEAKLHQECMERRSWTLVPRDAGTPSPS